MISINKRLNNNMLFELSIRGIDTSAIKSDNEKVKKRSPEEEDAMKKALEEAKIRKAREYGR